MTKVASITPNLVNTPITKTFIEPIREFSDKDDIYGYERRRELVVKMRSHVPSVPQSSLLDIYQYCISCIELCRTKAFY